MLGLRKALVDVGKDEGAELLRGADEEEQGDEEDEDGQEDGTAAEGAAGGESEQQGGEADAAAASGTSAGVGRGGGAGSVARRRTYKGMKLHMVRHLSSWIDLFGMPRVWDSATFETFHKPIKSAWRSMAAADKGKPQSHQHKKLLAKLLEERDARVVTEAFKGAGCGRTRTGGPGPLALGRKIPLYATREPGGRGQEWEVIDPAGHSIDETHGPGTTEYLLHQGLPKEVYTALEGGAVKAFVREAFVIKSGETRFTLWAYGDRQELAVVKVHGTHMLAHIFLCLEVVAPQSKAKRKPCGAGSGSPVGGAPDGGDDGEGGHRRRRFVGARLLETLAGWRQDESVLMPFRTPTERPAARLRLLTVTAVVAPVWGLKHPPEVATEGLAGDVFWAWRDSAPLMQADLGARLEDVEEDWIAEAERAREEDEEDEDEEEEDDDDEEEGQQQRRQQLDDEEEEEAQEQEEEQQRDEGETDPDLRRLRLLAQVYWRAEVQRLAAAGRDARRVQGLSAPTLDAALVGSTSPAHPPPPPQPPAIAWDLSPQPVGAGEDIARVMQVHEMERERRAKEDEDQRRQRRETEEKRRHEAALQRPLETRGQKRRRLQG